MRPLKYDVWTWFEDLSSERKRSDEMQRCPAAVEGGRFRVRVRV